MNAYILVRILWAGLVLIGVAAVVLVLMPAEVKSGADNVAPIPVPGAGQNGGHNLLAGYVDVALPQWNVFDPEGKPWKLQREAPRQPKTVEAKKPDSFKLEGVKGILQLPGLDGMVTEKGFVEVGETYEGARIREVQSGSVIFTAKGKEQILTVNPERDKRRASFEQFGLPFLAPAGGR